MGASTSDWEVRERLATGLLYGRANGSSGMGFERLTHGGHVRLQGVVGVEDIGQKLEESDGMSIIETRLVWVRGE